MRLHGNVIGKLRKAGYKDGTPADACLKFLIENKDYGDLAASKKLGVSESTIYNWRKKHTNGILKGLPGSPEGNTTASASFSKGFQSKLEKLGYEKGEDEKVVSVMRRFLRDALITSKLTIEQVASKLQTSTDGVEYWIKRSTLQDEIMIPRKIKKEKPMQARKKPAAVNKGTTIEQSIEDAIIGNAHSIGRRYIHTMIKGMYAEIGEVLGKIK